MAVTTHPTNESGGMANDERIITDVFGSHRAGSHECVSSSGDSTYDSRVSADGRAFLDDGLLIECMAGDLGTRIGHICQDTRGPQKHIVFDNDARVHRDVVLDFHVSADDGSGVDIHILSDYAPRTYFRAFHHMAEMPYLGTFPYFRAVIEKS